MTPLLSRKKCLQSNLEIVVYRKSRCFQVGNKFCNRALKFPGLISGCTINWYQRWPKDALVAVAHHFLNNFHIDCSSDVKGELIHTMAYIHDQVAVYCIDYFERFCT